MSYKTKELGMCPECGEVESEEFERDIQPLCPECESALKAVWEVEVDESIWSDVEAADYIDGDVR